MLEYTCAFQCGPDGEGWKEPGFLVVPACPVHGWMAAALAAERQARQDADRRGDELAASAAARLNERDRAEAALDDAREAANAECERADEAVAALADVRRALDELEADALQLLDRHISPEVRKETQLRIIEGVQALAALDSLPVQPRAPEQDAASALTPTGGALGAPEAATTAASGEPPPPSEPRENFTRGLGRDSQMPTMGGWPAVPPDTQPPRAKLTFGTTVDSISRASGGGGERNR